MKDSPFSQRIVKVSENNSSRIILALDLNEKLEKLVSLSLGILEKTSSQLCGVKVNMHLLLPLGLVEIRRILRKIHDNDLQAVADLKLNDIASTNISIANRLWEMGFDAVIVNPVAGFEGGLDRLIEESRRRDKGVIGLVYMSHPGAEETYGLRLENGNSLHDFFLVKALEWGLDGIVVGATRPEEISRISKIVGGKILIFSPGVGVQGGIAGRVRDLGADFLIVGRSIVEAANPLKAAAQIRLETWR